MMINQTLTNYATTHGYTLQVELITMTFVLPSLLGGLQYVGPAFDSAKEEIKQNYPYLNITQTFVDGNRYADRYDDWLAVYENVLGAIYFNANRHYERFDITAFVMSGTDDVTGVARFAAQTDNLMLSSVGQALNFRDKTRFPTWITTSCQSIYTYLKFHDRIMQMFNWTDVTVVTDVTSNIALPYMAGLTRNSLAASSRNQVSLIRFNSKYFQPSDYRELMLNVSRACRVMMYFGHSPALQRILLAAADLNMTNGDYVFIAEIPFRQESFGTFRWAPESKYDTETEEKKSIFRTSFVIELLTPTDNGTMKFNEEWRIMSSTKYNYTYGPQETMTPHPTSTYSAMMALAQILEELRLRSLKSGQVTSSGRAIASILMNRTFALKTGRMTIDEAGERIPTIGMTQTDLNTGQVAVVIMQDAENTHLKLVTPIKWPNVWPVPNRPRCGFCGEATVCQMTSDSSIAVQYGAIFSTVIAVITLVSIAVYTRLRAVSGYWWKLKADMVKFVECAGHVLDSKLG